MWEIIEGESSSTRRMRPNDARLLDTIFSWSLQDIFNENLFKNKVEDIPISFVSASHYYGSFVYPLLEETRAQLCSTMEVISEAPFAEVISFRESKPFGKRLYNGIVDCWRNSSSGGGKEPYKTLPGDVFVLTEAKPETIFDLEGSGKSWRFASVVNITDDKDADGSSTSTSFRVQASDDISFDKSEQASLFVVFLLNIIPSKRMWSALHLAQNTPLMNKIIRADHMVEESCDCCDGQIVVTDDNLVEGLSSPLDESQRSAVLTCISRLHCNQRSALELIWGPPGTGKTKTLVTLLLTLRKMQYRVLTCAPTNVAITEVASRFLSFMKASFEAQSDTVFCSFGDILLFGNNERLKVGSDLEEIYLDHRLKLLLECFTPSTGWRHCFASMTNFLEDCVSQYHIFIENEHLKEQELLNGNQEKGGKILNQTGACKSFLEFTKETFVAIAAPLRKCISILCSHISRAVILEENIQKMVCLIDILGYFETSLFKKALSSEDLEKQFTLSEVHESPQWIDDSHYLLYKRKTECVSVLRDLQRSLGAHLPSCFNQEKIKDFCIQTSSIIFCTSSSSFKLHSVDMVPLNVLVIDEAAQLKECESIIPLKLPGIKHAILVGDEHQLPATVVSHISSEAGFGRSLYERVSFLGYSKHLLNTQYRMHPSISTFPNSYFYSGKLCDAYNVQSKDYGKCYLPGPMFGNYSFINLVGGVEERDDVGRSRMNMVEVAVVTRILHRLHKEWIGSKVSLSIGVISPYAAQVAAIQAKLSAKYDDDTGFLVKVRTIDGFQGGELDIIIISTVRTTGRESLRFISSPQRINVALTRARHCLWILGNERTLASRESVWEALVRNAKHRQCFFSADDDKDLAKTILNVKKELKQFDDLLCKDSVLFKSCRWKVLFSDNFLKSFRKLKSVHTKKSVLNLLLNLASGWRPRRINVDSGSPSQILKQFKVESFFVVCSNDIVKESTYIQVLKIWDILPLEDVGKLVKRLNNIFERYSEDYMNHCKARGIEGKLEVPVSWPESKDIVRFKSTDDVENEGELNDTSDGRSYVENTMVGESLILMKFYSVSPTVVKYLITNREGSELDLPFEVTDEELEIILHPSSTFILGRSGTGKTTVLTMKLFQKEKLHHLATETVFGPREDILPGNNKEEGGDCEEIERLVLRQLFVTVSPKLCSAVKNHVTRMKRSLSGGNLLESSSADVEDIDAVSLQLKSIPDSFVNIPVHCYPLVITFEKFLMMLDGTLPNSYFERFSEIKKLSYDDNHVLRSVALERFTRMKEVNYDRFASSYWPHFNSQLTKMLDSSRVFTEIMSHIKGGPQAAEPGDGKLSREEYVQLSEKRGSSLSRRKREQIYGLFENYEKMKMANGEFDLADLVIYLHHQLRTGKYVLDEVHYVYVDEVQDLTMSQIALFKYICKNVKEGFVFSGDTAQTIARGIDFRFQDIRALFYKKFILSQAGDKDEEKREKGLISDIFHLSQNFRTHAGVLKLSQSIIDLLYRFFPHSIDVLNPETSLICGESPVVLESGDNENAIIKIFGNSGDMDAKIVGFGAEQVILVRDDTARQEISGYVGKRALVLTILECKGLEFQDVLLYNFFGSSPLKNKWRVIYEYMHEQDLLDSEGPISKQSFNHSKHNLLCSELKQLYVAVTRTRQRLWICDNSEELSAPMFCYWKKKCLVQARKLDDSLAQAMQVASSPEEWKLRGQKLYQERNYEMATTCFERAGDAYWERRSKAAGLKASADRMWSSNNKDATASLRVAGEIFESIKMSEVAAQCYSDVGDYERAGRLYMEKSGEADFERAGACFLFAGRYEMAAEVYARGNLFSDCLKACSEGKLYDIGFDYIQNWKDHEAADHVIICRNQLENIEQGFLESCARHYAGRKDYKSMMKFVKAFHSRDLMRTFLKSSDLLDELLLLEKEFGNFLEAANIARLRGDIILQADLLGMAMKYKEASHLILVYVLSNSLWSSGSKGWPLKQFTEKEKLLEKAKLLAKNESSDLFEFVSNEAEALSMKKISISTIVSQLNSSRRCRSARSEFLSIRKILDAHLQLNVSQYVWQDELIGDTMRCIEGILPKVQVSVGSLIFFWRCWKDKIITILEFLESLKTQDASKYGDGQFALELLGVLKHSSNESDDYLLLNPDADWVHKMDYKSLKRNGKLICVGVKPLVSAAWIYWCSELLSVGLDVLHKLQDLHVYSTGNKLDIYHQSISLVQIYQIARFLLDRKFAHHSHGSINSLEKYIALATGHIFGYVFPLDWRKSLSREMVSLRGTEICQDLLNAVVFENARRTSKMTYGQLGRIAVITLGSLKLQPELHSCILQKLGRNSSWREYLEVLFSNAELEVPQEIIGGDVSFPQRQSVLYMISFLKALQETYNANWMEERDYIHPNCFLYLVERVILFASCHEGFIFTTKSSFLEWLIYQDNGSNNHNLDLLAIEHEEFKNRIITSIGDMIMPLLSNMKNTKEWIEKSGSELNPYCSFLVLRLIVIICLLDLSSGFFVDALRLMLSQHFIIEHMPQGVYEVLRRGNNRSFESKMKSYAEAFKLIGNPLVIVASENNLETRYPDAVIIDRKISHQKEDVLQILFPKRIEEHVETDSVELRQMNSSSNFFPSTNDSSLSSSNFDQHLIDAADIVPELTSNDGCFQDLFDSLQSIAKDVESGAISCIPSLKGEINKSIQLFGAESFQLSLTACVDHDDKNLLKDIVSLFDDLKQFYRALDVSEAEVQDNTSAISEISQKIRIGLPKFHLLHKLLSQKQKNAVQNVTESTEPSNNCNENRDSQVVSTGQEGKTKGKKNQGKKNKKSRRGRK